jgi:hypothetical protein
MKQIINLWNIYSHSVSLSVDAIAFENYSTIINKLETDIEFNDIYERKVCIELINAIIKTIHSFKEHSDKYKEFYYQQIKLCCYLLNYLESEITYNIENNYDYNPGKNIEIKIII